VNQPLVSIIIAVYKPKSDHLLAALDSALVQTLDDIEVLVVDDSPTDTLKGIVNALRDPRVLYEHNSPALGVAENHWHAIRKARGEYISFLNHDDCLEPGFAATLYNELVREPAAVLAFCDHWIIDNEGRRQLIETDRNSIIYGRATLGSGLHLPFGNLLLTQSIPMAMGAMFRRVALPDKLPKHAGPAYDLWITYLLARTGGGACYVPERLSAWRIHGSNISGSGNISWLLGSAMLWETLVYDSSITLNHGSVKRKAAQGLLSCATRSWLVGNRRDCLRFSVRSLRLMFSFRAAAMFLFSVFIPAKLISRQRPSLR
jgi:glycosyltransferase involved in cell wall biosynthesis